MTEPGAGSEGPAADAGRPISVAELLARNGTIGSPPVGGRRRRRRGNSAAVTVAELTGEIPVIRDEDPAPPTEDERPGDTPPHDATDETATDEAATDETATDETATDETAADEAAADDAASDEAASDEAADAQGAAVESETDSTMVIVESSDDEPAGSDVPATDETEATDETGGTDEPGEPAEETSEAVVITEERVTDPPLSADPMPRRGEGPELSHDPRPVRRGLGAEQMAPDPVDQSVDLAGLVADGEHDAEALRSYLKSSGGTLFGGQSMADDLARRDAGTVADGEQPSATDAVESSPRGARLGPGAVRQVAIALGQSTLAVIFGAGLFIAFDQLWRWNNLVALVLSVLVILGLVVAVRVVRRTEDIASTLIAVAVGALVTLGPLALLQST